MTGLCVLCDGWLGWWGAGIIKCGNPWNAFWWCGCGGWGCGRCVECVGCVVCVVCVGCVGGGWWWCVGCVCVWAWGGGAPKIAVGGGANGIAPTIGGGGATKNGAAFTLNPLLFYMIINIFIYNVYYIIYVYELI